MLLAIELIKEEDNNCFHSGEKTNYFTKNTFIIRRSILTIKNFSKLNSHFNRRFKKIKFEKVPKKLHVKISTESQMKNTVFFFAYSTAISAFLDSIPFLQTFLYSPSMDRQTQNHSN